VSDHPIVDDVRRIAVLRGGALGDFVFTLPALDALRAAYPDAEIVLLGRRSIAELVDGRPGPVDRFIPLPELRWLGGARETGQTEDDVLTFLAAERFDLAVQLHGGGRHSNPFIRRIGARLTVGARDADAEPLDRTIPFTYYQSEVMRHLEVVGLVGAEPVGFEPRYRGVNDRDRAAARAVLPPATGRLVVVHPSATDPRRRWPPESFAAVADAVALRTDATVAVIGTAEDRRVVTAVVGTMRAEAVDLCGRLGLSGLAGLLAQADLIVGNDSGPLHLGASVGAATVGIFWCGNVINAGPFTRARHRPILSWRLACPVCGTDCTRDSCPHRDTFVADAPVEEAIAAALDLLAVRRDAAAELAAV
jgi:ADP-heptose:LPS heptosyltransferase